MNELPRTGRSHSPSSPAPLHPEHTAVRPPRARAPSVLWHRRQVALVALLTPLIGVVSGAQAKPVGPAELCRNYPEIPACADGPAACTTCHTTPPERNAFGRQVEAELLPGTPRPLSDARYLDALGDALAAVEDLDADGDGASNWEELQAGTSLVSASSAPGALPDCDARARAVAGEQGWNTCGYDPAYALRRIALDFCGRSPSRAELMALEQGGNWRAALEQKWASCVDSDFWRGKDGVLWNLANAKILPEGSLKGGDGAGDIPIGDYDDDYNLFVYLNTDDRDVRELLTAEYHVLRSSDGTLLPVVRTPLEDIEARDFERAQLVMPGRRAGMLTTRWFLVKNTMFTPIPRTTAAQAYRAYLGYDIAKMEGLLPVADEPVDYDRKGVRAPECAVCHSTLDPLSYGFSRYDGLGGGDEEPFDFEAAVGPDGSVEIAFGTYTPERLERFERQEGSQIVDTPETGVLLGQPVADLVEWGEVAANSDAFARKVVLDYWRLLVGEEPRANTRAEFAQLQRGLAAEHGFRVEGMLRDLIFTEAYGAP